jgi:hypothetical protein
MSFFENLQKAAQDLGDQIQSAHEKNLQQMASLSNSTILSDGVLLIKKVVVEQLTSIDSSASDLIHYNEPYNHLKDISVNFDHEKFIDYSEIKSLGESLAGKLDISKDIQLPESPSIFRLMRAIDEESSVKQRADKHFNESTKENRKKSLELIQGAVKEHGVNTNFPILIQSCLALAVASYNVRLSVDNNIDSDLMSEETQRINLFANISLGHDEVKPDMQVHQLRSEKACAIFVLDPSKSVAMLAFRGTKDGADAITDFTSTPVSFSPDTAYANPPSGMNIHIGFKEAFATIKDQLHTHISALPDSYHLIITGHSMGGALAQLSAAYYAHLSPILVTFGMPSIGNSEFVSFVEKNIHPSGGIRVYNEGDVVPEITKLVGYLHAGVPVKMHVKDSAKDLYTSNYINEIVPTYDGAAPHIIFQVLIIPCSYYI